MSFGIQWRLDTGGLKPGIRWLVGQWQANASSNPAASTFLGSAAGRMTVTRTGTGLFQIVMGAGLVFPQNPVIQCSNTCADATNTHRFFCFVIPTSGNVWSNTTRTFSIQCYQDGTGAFDPPNNAGNLVGFAMEAIDNTGK